MEGIRIPSSVHELTPTARLAYLALSSERSLSTMELPDGTGVCRRSAEKVLHAPREADVVDVETNPLDGQRKTYTAASADGDTAEVSA